MAFTQVIAAFLLALALARIDPSACAAVKGKISCLDCTQNYDFSGIKLSAKCDNIKKLGVATAADDGSFKIDLPSDGTSSVSPVNCQATILGGSTQLYGSRKSLVSLIVKGQEQNSYIISTPLSFFTSCPLNTRCKAANELGSSETVDLPLPREWGLAPTSYYVPFFPIIGIP
ncbi:hypothetical protein L6164_022133 [Bauhinia variegata]|uniref:Uncharacterized protein n=1 Tax=Bauhinia variegata TaxID=167791 RepID=A0ACB9ME75_BAUVA|nr:hypothetical protein L6164_022133 [Bauhinia variegata]